MKPTQPVRPVMKRNSLPVAPSTTPIDFMGNNKRGMLSKIKGKVSRFFGLRKTSRPLYGNSYL